MLTGGAFGGNMPSHRRIIAMPADRVIFVADINERIASQVRDAMGLLDRFLD